MKPRWMVAAEKDLGQHEVAGDKANPRVMTMFSTIGADWVKDDSTPWCAAATGTWLEENGIKSTRSALARSYLKWGRELDAPLIGCVAVLSRGSDPNAGHVGLYAGERGDKVLILAGNQNDEVNISAFPKARVLGYRWPEGEPMETDPDVSSSRTIAKAGGLQKVGAAVAVTGGVAQAAPALPIPAPPDINTFGAWKGVLVTVVDFWHFTAAHWPIALGALGVYLVISGNAIKKFRIENAKQWLKDAIR